jgi:hypothetical protein
VTGGNLREIPKVLRFAKGTKIKVTETKVRRHHQGCHEKASSGLNVQGATPARQQRRRALQIHQCMCDDMRHEECFLHLDKLYELVHKGKDYLAQTERGKCNKLCEDDYFLFQQFFANNSSCLGNNKNADGKYVVCDHCEYIKAIPAPRGGGSVSSSGCSSPSSTVSARGVAVAAVIAAPTPAPATAAVKNTEFKHRFLKKFREYWKRWVLKQFQYVTTTTAPVTTIARECAPFPSSPLPVAQHKRLLSQQPTSPTAISITGSDGGQSAGSPPGSPEYGGTNVHVLLEEVRRLTQLNRVLSANCERLTNIVNDYEQRELRANFHAVLKQHEKKELQCAELFEPPPLSPQQQELRPLSVVTVQKKRQLQLSDMEYVHCERPLLRTRYQYCDIGECNTNHIVANTSMEALLTAVTKIASS